MVPITDSNRLRSVVGLDGVAEDVEHRRRVLRRRPRVAVLDPDPIGGLPGEA